MRFFLTTAIDYVNSRPHLGTAYEKITADVIARYKRLAGFETHFLMGNDEHSQNVYKRAVERGMDPLAYCDQMEQEFRSVWRQLDISFDDFIRTTEPRHRAAVQKMAQANYDAGDIYEGFYEGWYCVSCEAFKQEKDLVDGRCSIHTTQPAEWIKEKNYFFRLSKYCQPLLDHFHAHPGFLQPDVRRNEMLRLLEGGLEDISARDRPGAFRCRSIRRTSFTCGTTRSSTTPPLSATGPMMRGSRNRGRRICTWSGRTSRGSTPSSGPPC
jgi:methionyl-tRNA synthetase